MATHTAGETLAASDETDEVRFVLFGGVRIVRGGIEAEVTQPKQRALLALLLVNAGGTVGVTSLVDALWTREPAASAINQLHRHVGALRRECEPGLGRRQAGRFIIGTGHGYRISVDPDASDVTRFRGLVGRARELGEAGDHAGALQSSLRALAVAATPAGDDALQELPEFAALEDERVNAILAATDECHDRSDWAAVLPFLRSAVERHPYNESLAARLMDALSRTERRAEAVTLYRAVRRRLRGELGCEPGSRLRRALAHAVGDDTSRPAPGLTRSASTGLPRPAQLPLPGPVGRRRLLSALAASTDRRRVLLVTGRTGAGKTNLAVRHATEIAERYPDGQLFVDLHGHDRSAEPTRPMDALEDMLVGLGVPGRVVPRSLTARSGLLRSVLASRRVLLVLDDARDFDQVEPLLPGSGPSDVIVTARGPVPELVALAHSESVELPSRQVDELPGGTHFRVTSDLYRRIGFAERDPDRNPYVRGLEKGSATG